MMLQSGLSNEPFEAIKHSLEIFGMDCEEMFDLMAIFSFCLAILLLLNKQSFQFWIY